MPIQIQQLSQAVPSVTTRKTQIQCVNKNTSSTNGKGNGFMYDFHVCLFTQ